MDEKVENSNLEEIMKDSTLSNPDLTFCEKTTYLDFLLSNAQTDEEREEIKKTISNFLEISKDDETELVIEEDTVEDDDEVEIEKIDDYSLLDDEDEVDEFDEDDEFDDDSDDDEEDSEDDNEKVE